MLDPSGANHENLVYYIIITPEYSHTSLNYLTNRPYSRNYLIIFVYLSISHFFFNLQHQGR